MNYIWEMEVRDCSGRTFPARKFYKQAEEFSPYYEQCGPCLNRAGEEEVIYFNSFYRFEDIFGALFSTQEVPEKVRETLFDILVHYLISLDLRAGLSAQDYLLKQLETSVEEGDYGSEVMQQYRMLDGESRHKICLYLLRQFQAGASIRLCGEVLYKVMESGVLYTNKLDRKILLYYAEIPREPASDNKIQIIQRLFLPLDYRIRVFWENHFGILGEGDTMQWGKIEIY